MGIVQTVSTIALPLLAGVLVASAFFQLPLRRINLLVSGYGILLGLLLATLILRLLDAAGLALAPGPFVAGVALLTLTAYAGYRRAVASSSHTSASRVADTGDLSRVESGVLLVLVGLVLFHLGLVGYELITRPLFPFDATMHWATKSKVWFEHAAMVPFVENQAWLDLGGTGVFTDHHPGYPPTVPLLQVWTAMALGYWDESLVNLPWLLLAMALAAAFYGQARAVGIDALTASVFTYFLLSLPLLNTHIALAGYADLVLGVTYAAALMALHRWQQNRRPSLLMLALVLALLSTQIKNEGLYWAATLLPAILVVLLPARWILAGVVSGLVTLLLIFLFLPGDLIIAGHSLEGLRLAYRSESLPALASMWFGSESWHLMGYLLILLPVGMLLSRKRVADYSALATALCCAIVLYLVLFVFTRFSYGAINQTAAGRIGLHLTPALMFLGMLVWDGYRRSRAPVPTAPGKPSESG